MRRVMPSRNGGPPEEEILPTDFYYQHLLADEELQFLMEAVAFSSYLPATFRKDTMPRLRQLANRHFKPHHAVISGGRSPANHDLFLTVGILDEAVRLDRKVGNEISDVCAGQGRGPAAGCRRKRQIYPSLHIACAL